MGTSNFPEMYAQSHQAVPSDFGHTFQVNHKCPCYNYYVTLLKANSLNANTSTTTGFFIYADLKGPKYGYAASKIVAMIVIINGLVLWISQKV